MLSCGIIVIYLDNKLLEKKKKKRKQLLPKLQSIYSIRE